MFNFLYQSFQVTLHCLQNVCSVPRTLFTLSDLSQFISCPVLKAVASCWRIFPQLCVGLCLQCHHLITSWVLPSYCSFWMPECCLFQLPSIRCSDSRAGGRLCLSQKQLLVADTAQGTLFTHRSVQAADQDLCPLAFPVHWGQWANDLMCVRHQE